MMVRRPVPSLWPELYQGFPDKGKPPIRRQSLEKARKKSGSAGTGCLISCHQTFIRDHSWHATVAAQPI